MCLAHQNVKFWMMVFGLEKENVSYYIKIFPGLMTSIIMHVIWFIALKWQKFSNLKKWILYETSKVKLHIISIFDKLSTYSETSEYSNTIPF